MTLFKMPFQVLKAVMNPRAIPATQAWVKNATVKGDLMWTNSSSESQGLTVRAK